MKVHHTILPTVTLLALLGMMFSISPTLPITHAQDGGLTDEQIAMLDRVYTAVDHRDNYTSFNLDIQETRTQSMDISVGGPSFTIEQAVSRTETRTTLRADEQENSQSLVTLDFAENGLDGQTAYVMEAEIRVVDGVLYLNATYSEATPDLPNLSPGWQAFDQVDSIPSIFNELDLNGYLEEDEDDPFDDRELIERIVSDISVEASETVDGTPVDVITFTIEGDGMREFMAASADEEEAAENPFIGVYASDATVGAVVYTIALDADNNALEVSIEWSISVEEFDVSTVSDQFPPDTILSLELSNARQETVTDINADLEPAVAPEIG